MKVGIVTHYFKSKNYGGNLQAYALSQFINQIGRYTSFQISYDRRFDNVNRKNTKSKYLRKICRFFLQGIKKLFTFFLWRKIRQRNLSFNYFNQNFIPHTKEVFTQKTINQVNDEFDCFIVGSDQVWAPSAVCDFYLLKFAQKGKYKFSYAASLACKYIDDEKKIMYANALQNLNTISVREENGAEQIQSLTKIKVELVLDPTLLLSSEDWNKICPERRIKENYVFCYFLGGIKKYRKTIKPYAKSKKLKIVTLPYLAGAIIGENFGDYRLFDISPADFISLIKYADCVFTDSFHATVFSHIYRKDFFVFQREGYKGMSDRIYSLTSLFDTQERFCDTREKANINYVKNLKAIDYNRTFIKFEEMKEKSIKFLESNLLKAEQMLKNGQ